MHATIKIVYFSACLISEAWMCPCKLVFSFLHPPPSGWGPEHLLTPSRGRCRGPGWNSLQSPQCSGRGDTALSLIGEEAAQGVSVMHMKVKWQGRHEGGIRTLLYVNANHRLFPRLLTSVTFQHYSQDGFKMDQKPFGSTEVPVSQQVLISFALSTRAQGLGLRPMVSDAWTRMRSLSNSSDLPVRGLSQLTVNSSFAGWHLC